jgi:AcrR family transcriptional regulator
MSMPRRTPPNRVTDIARAACRVFIKKGYQRTLMTDVGQNLGLSHALLYRYVESKEALFHLALIYATDPGALPGLTIPMPTPPPGETLALIDKWLAGNVVYPVLAAALEHDQCADVRRELAEIVDERYAVAERHRRLLALIEQSAADLPELHTLYFVRSRRENIAKLASYLHRRIESGVLRPVPDVATAARFIVETIAWFARHRKGDPDSAMISDDQARETVRYLVVAAFVSDSQDCGAQEARHDQ